MSIHIRKFKKYEMHKKAVILLPCITVINLKFFPVNFSVHIFIIFFFSRNWNLKTFQTFQRFLNFLEIRESPFYPVKFEWTSKVPI